MSSKRKQKAAAQMQMQQQATAEPEEPVYQAVRARTHDAASRARARARALASPFLTRDPASQPDPNTKITVPMQFAGKLDDSKFIIIWRVSRSR